MHSSKQSLLWKRKLPELPVNTGQIARRTARASPPKSMDVKQSSTQLNRPSQASASRSCNGCTYRSGAKKVTMIKRQKQEYQWQSDASKTETVHFEKEASLWNWLTVQSSKAKKFELLICLRFFFQLNIILGINCWRQFFFIKKWLLFGPQLTKHYIIQITAMSVFNMLHLSF